MSQLSLFDPQARPDTPTVGSAGDVSPDEAVAAAVAVLLRRTGVAAGDVPAQVAAECQRLLDVRGHAATFASLRHGKVTVNASPQVAALLAWDVDWILDQLQVAFPHQVRTVTVRTR